MIINSNISKANKVHDLIRYEPIERQIHTELLKTKSFSYEIVDGFLFKIEHAGINVSIKKGKVNITVIPHHEYGLKYDPTLWTDIKPLEIKLKVNVDVSKEWESILAYVDSINNFQNEYKQIVIDNRLVDTKIREELGKYFNNDILECWYFSGSNPTHFGISISPKNTCAADGAYYRLDGNLLSIDYRDMDNLINHLRLGNDVTSLRKKMEVIAYVEDKTSKFNISDFPLASTMYNHIIAIKALLTKYGIQSRYNNF